MSKKENSSISETKMRSPLSDWLGFVPALVLPSACPWLFLNGSIVLAVGALGHSTLLHSTLLIAPGSFEGYSHKIRQRIEMAESLRSHID